MVAMLRITIAAILLFGLSNPVSAQSFDCRKAQTRIEKMICADAGLSELDEHLGRYYAEPSRCTFIHRMPATALRTPGVSNDQDQEKEMEKIQKTVLPQGRVCSDPNRPCEGFKPNELSFAIKQPFKFDRGRDRSQPFYAVILKSGPLCGVDDSERIQAQKIFPGAKVFLHRHFCEDFGDKVTYSNVSAKSGFVAVYGGETEADAKKVLAQAIAAGYKDANVRRMEVVVVYQLE